MVRTTEPDNFASSRGLRVPDYDNGKHIDPNHYRNA